MATEISFRLSGKPSLPPAAAQKFGDFEYEQRVLAFIDILGFSKLAQRSSADQNARAQVAKLTEVTKLFERFVAEYLTFAEAAFFSDCFILSMTPPDLRTLFVIREVGYLCRYLLWQGFVCRGAITSGALYHRERLIVGPALVCAYQLEQSVAIYPRVILDDETMAHWRNEFIESSPHSDFQSMVKRDRDGQNFLDIFSPVWTTTLPWTEFLPTYDQVPTDPTLFLEKIAVHIAEGLADGVGDLKVRSKYEWLAAQHRDAVDGSR